MKEGAYVRLAREAIESAFTKKSIARPEGKKFSEQHGVFVTLTKEGELRGCIGYPQATYPLAKGIIKAAKAAAFEDPRFPPLEPEELGEIRVEVTVLSEAQPIHVQRPEEYLQKITIGRDGLIIRNSYHTGLLLPQVPVEYGWNTETYLEHLCTKAGLPKDAWKDTKTEIKAFQGTIHTE